MSSGSFEMMLLCYYYNTFQRPFPHIFLHTLKFFSKDMLDRRSRLCVWRILRTQKIQEGVSRPHTLRGILIKLSLKILAGKGISIPKSITIPLRFPKGGGRLPPGSTYRSRKHGATRVRERNLHIFQTQGPLRWKQGHAR